MPRAQQISAELADPEPTYRLADDVEDLARRLIRENPRFAFIDDHGFKIAYLLKLDGPPEDDKIDTVAKCQKASALWSFLSGYDFVITVNAHWWSSFPQHREPILFHELLHVDVTDKGAPAIAHHDVEEFISVAAAYGAWESSRRRLGEALANPVAAAAEQLREMGAVSAEEREDGSVQVTVDLDHHRKRRRS